MAPYAMRGTPTLILIDRTGRIRAHEFGQIDDMAVGARIAQLVPERDASLADGRNQRGQRDRRRAVSQAWDRDVRASAAGSENVPNSFLCILCDRFVPPANGWRATMRRDLKAKERAMRRASLQLGIVLGIAAGAASAQSSPTWPTKPVKIVVMASPGGLVDVAARIIASHLAKMTTHSVVVENRPGGGGNIATEFVAKSAPDGHTLLSTGSNHAVNQTLLPNPGFDYVKDVAPVTMLGQGNMVLVATPTLQASNVAELVALAKRSPRTISIGHGPIGTPGHVATELFANMAGVELIVVPYKGIGSAVADIVSGQVHLGIGALPAVQPLINAGRLKALAVTAAMRTPVMPNVPTVGESGVPGFDVITWISLMTTGGTPAPLLDRISADIRTIMALPDVREAFEKQGTEVVTSTPVELAAYIKAEAVKWAGVLKNVKIQSQ